MRITLISRSWPSHERSGVSLSAFSHARLLLEQGHEVSIIGAVDDMQSLTIPVAAKSYIPASGSGSLYSPVKVERAQLKKSIAKNHPDLVIVEAWQTAITDSAIDAASELSIPVLMISHGISLHPYQNTIIQFMRSLAWLPYRFFKLPRLMKKLSAITALDESSTSTRFFDRDLARRNGVPVAPLKNFPIHQIQVDIPRVDRKNQILVVGYFSAVKNQLTAINLLPHLPNDLTCCFIGDRRGAYYALCRSRVIELGLEHRVTFLQDDECDLAQEIALSILVFAPSLTEALPLTLIEAMACGTPFVATSVGAVSSLSGGVLADNAQSQIDAIGCLANDAEIWRNYADAGKKQYRSEFTEERIAMQLAHAVKTATVNSLPINPIRLGT